MVDAAASRPRDGAMMTLGLSNTSLAVQSNNYNYTLLTIFW